MTRTSYFLVIAMAVCLLLGTYARVVLAADAVEVRKADNIVSFLERSTGKRAEIMLESGEKLSGKVEKVASGVLHLSTLSGKEFYDAVIRLESISAVIVRARDR